MFGQITVTQSSNSQALSQLLAGSGVTISNYTLSCSANGSGTFTNVNTNLGMPGGVVLASGRVQNIPNNAGVFASSQFTASGDVQLSTLTNGTIYDPCILEFDVVPQGPLLKFDYVFASEEYPEWVCSQFNDVFGFFISGPKPGGGNYANQNIALITNTNLPVAINTVNPGTPGANANGGQCNGVNQTLGYNSIYTNNQVPLNTSIVYDGMTHLLTATAAVTPCQTYHLKIAVADVADRIYDSGVFLSAYSFNANPVSISATSNLNYAGFSSAYEGCVGGTFTITLSQAQTVDLYVPLSINGSAINGVDYSTIPTTVVIPAGQTSVTIPLNPLTDALVEGVESVTIATLNPCNGTVSSTANINIRDDIAPTVTVGDSTLCLGQSTQLTANGGATYSWTPTAGLSNPAIKNPIATPTSTTTYVCSMTFGACTKTVAQTIYISNPANTIVANPNGVVCNGGSVQLTSTPVNGVAPYSYLWSNGNTSATVTAIAGGTFNVTATDAYGCSASATQSVTISNLAISGTSANVSCKGGSNGAIDITVTGANAPFTYNWGGGIVSQDRNNLLAGTYSVTASNTIGCSVTATYSITEPAANLVSTATNNPVTCNGGNNGSINLTPNGGVTPYSFLWSNTAISEDINALTAGSYSVTVTDFNGCTTSRTINITQPTAIVTSETHTNGDCFGSSIGAIDLTVSGGTGAYTYGWSNGAATQDVTALSAGTYGVTVADANGCTVSRNTVITQPAAISIIPTVTDPACFGNNNGAIATVVSGGTGSYTYLWSNSATTQNIAGLAVGTFTVTATDANGCSGTASAVLTQPAILTLSAAKTDVNCNAAATGTITTTVTGGTPSYNYNWGGGITTANRSGLTAGTYTVTTTDSHGCTATASATITQPTALAVSQVHTNISCNGAANGSIDLTASGGTLPYGFNWGAGITSEDRSNIAAGTYSVTVTDAQTCSASLTATVTQPATLSVALATVNPVCNGAATGTVSSTVTGGTAPFTFNWVDGSTSQNRTGLAAGTYTLNLTDANGCTATASASLTQPTAIGIVPVVTNATCAAGNNGTITLTVTGGAGSYTYNWGGGITTPGRIGLVAGTYTVTVTDALSCTASLPITITQIGTGITLTTAITNVSCNAGSNGAIDLSVAGGIAPVSYNWGGSITTEDRSALSAGTYTVTVTDGVGCSAVTTSSVTQPVALAIQRTSTNVACYGTNGGSVNISATGGTGAYTYNWGGGITTQNRTALTAGTYTVTVSDANLCTAVSTTVITQPVAALTPSAVTTAVSCFGGNNGQVDVSVAGGTTPYNYSWSNNNISQDLNNVNSGTYQLTITDANSCTAAITATVTQPVAVLAATLATTNVLCNASATGAIVTTVAGGTSAYAFSWNDGVITQNRAGLSAGTYTVTVTDSKGCQATATGTITQPAALSVALVANNITCNGLNNGAIATTVTGGQSAYSYNWGGGIVTQNRSGLSAGTYALTVTDANSCTASGNATISQPSVLTVTMNSGTSVCANATGTATAVTNNTGTAPYNYVWSNAGNNSQTQNGLAPGVISVTVTDANSCSVSALVNVGLSGNNTNAAFTYAGTPCGPNATISFNHTGSTNVSHFWDFGNGVGTATLSNPAYTYPAAGTYQVNHIVTRGFCKDSIKQLVTIYPMPVPSAVATNVSCNGLNNGAIDLSVSSGTPSFNYNWGSAVTTQDRSGLAPGTYTVTVTDATPCSASLSVAITQPAVLTVTWSNTNVTCNGGNNGTIALTATGGTPAYIYNWGGGITTPTRTGLAGGTYTVTVTDANACSSTNNVVLYQPNAVAITTAVTNPSCNGMQNGAINIGVSGGNGAYTYNWGGGVTTQNRTGLGIGNYTVTVTDGNSCSGTAVATVTQPQPMATALAGMNVSCYGGDNGSIATTTTGGTAPFNYTWNDNNTNENRQTLAAGIYTVTALDANACSSTATITIAQPAAAVVVTVGPVASINCFGDSSGAINITTTGGTPSYNYSWSDGSTLQNRSNLQSGTYRVTATDTKGCQATASALINQPMQSLTIDSLVSNNVLCFGAATGSITTSVSGGTAPYTYNWNGGVTTQNRSNLTAGTYNLTVTDANSCSATTSAVITQPAAALAVSISSSANVSCFGGNNGAINVTATGGTGAYTYNWNGGITTPNRTNLTAGTYNLTVTDANSCSATITSTITQPAAALAVSVNSATNVSCFGGNNGAINVTATGGTMAYTYNWNGGVTTQNRTNLTAGTYNLTVTDANSCSATISSTITQPAAALAVSVSSATNVSCFGGNNGAINVTATGGTTAYTYNWNGGVTTQNRSNLTAGTYNLTVTDARSCSATTSAVITQPATALAVSISSSTNVSCFGGNDGAINVTATGGTGAYTYNWNGGVTTQNRSNLAAGTYNLTVTDANSCSATTSATITQPAAALAVAVSSATNVSCFGGNNGAINVTATGGTTAYTYNWNGGVTTQNRTNLTAGTYILTVTDARSCSATASAVITQPATSLAITSSTTNLSCNGGNNGSINITANGGAAPYTYNWGGGVTTEDRTALAAGTYTVTVLDANSCSATSANTIIQPPVLGGTISSISNVLCFGGYNGAVSVTATGGSGAYTYNWGNGITTPGRTGLVAGSYTVTITDANACTAVVAANITQPVAPLSTSVSSLNNVSCFGGSNGTVNVISTGGSGNYTYSWGNGSTTQSLSGVAAGNYNVTVTDANACTASASATIVQPNTSMQLAMNKTNLLCDGSNTGSINLTVTGGVQPLHFMWNNGTTAEDPQGLTAGLYTVSVTDNNGCTASNSISILSPYPIVLTETHTNVTCNAMSNANIYTTPSGGVPPYHYIWNTNATTRALMNVSGGSYSVVVTDSNGCSASLNAITVIEPAIIGVGVSITNIACAGATSGGVNVNVNGGTQPYQYHWSNNSTAEDLVNANAGTYTLTITDANGCSQTSSAFINAVPPMVMDAQVDVLACKNSEGGINLSVNSGTAPYTYIWNNGATTEDLTAIHPGTYAVTVHDANNCVLDTSFTVVNLNNFSVDATGGGTITLGEKVELHVTSTGSAQTTYSWTPTFGMDCSTCTDVTVQPGQATLYTVIGIDTNGCEAKDTVSVDVIEDHTIFPPNAFSPNGDGNNDVFQLFGNLAGIKTFNIMIFDRWGEKVFESNESTFSWDGTYKNELLPPSVCVYVMKAVFLDGRSEKIYKGSITILR
jgi:gliding motility-associated-like protein